jgi:hypothetical protein
MYRPFARGGYGPVNAGCGCALGQASASTTITVFGKSRWNCPRSTSPADVDDGREARMRDGAVVALEEVLGADLPVRLQLRLVAPEEAQRIHVDPR